MKQEFKTGDIVTFKPYEIAIKAKVVSVQKGLSPFHSDDRIFYHLSGIGKKRSEQLKSITTGASIMESELFDPWTEEKRANFFKD